MRLLLLTAVMFFAACNQKPNETSNTLATDLAGENLKGKVKQVKTETYNVDSATGKMGALATKTEEDYDDKGFSTTYISGDGKDSMTTTNTYTHNADGYMTGMSTIVNGRKKSSMTVEMNKDGKFTLAKSFDSAGKPDVFYKEITQNNFGEVTAANGYHKDSTLKMSFTNNYDSIYYIGGESKDSVGKVTSTNKLTLNDKKDAVKQEETTVTKEGTKTTATTYTYDGWDKENWTQQTTYNDKGRKTKITKRFIQYYP